MVVKQMLAFFPQLDYVKWKSFHVLGVQSLFSSLGEVISGCLWFVAIYVIESVLAYIPFGLCLMTMRCFLMNELETSLV